MLRKEAGGVEMQMRNVANTLAAAVVAAGLVAVVARGQAPRVHEMVDGGPGPAPPAPHSGFAQLFPRPSPPAVVQCVLHQHDPAPHLPEGFAINYMGGALIDGAGNILIPAVLEGPDVTPANILIDYYATAEDCEVLLWEGQPAPGFDDGVVISDLLGADECLAQNGLVAAIPEVSGPGIVPGYNDRVLYVGYPGSLIPVLQAGDQAIGCEPGVYIEPYSGYFNCCISNNGTLRVEADLAGPGVTYLNDSAVWVGPPDNLVLVYRKGMQAPGCPAGVTFAYADLFVHNDLGQVSFRAGLRGSGVTSANDQGHWVGLPGTLTKVAREGDQVVGMALGVTWKTAAGATESNGWGDVVQEGTLEGPGVTASNERVLYLGDPGDLVLAGRGGDPVPTVGPDAAIALLGMTLISDCREALYRVKFAGSGVSASNQWAMYLGPYGAGELTLRDGDPAPTFDLRTELWRVNDVPNLAGMNSVGDIVTPTEIQGGAVADADKVVLWMRHHVLQRWVPLLRSGMEIDGRTLYAEDETAFPCGATGGSDGRHRMLNDSGVLAMRLDFTDGTHGIFRISFPFGDGNQDGQVDLVDFSLMQSCWRGAGRVSGADGAVFDIDADGDVDLADMAMFQQLYSGG
jgi:hypothetical protein